MTTIHSISFLLILGTSTALAQHPTSTDRELEEVREAAQGQASDPQHARVDSIFARFNRKDSPGCAVAVMRAGTIVYARGYGMANLEHGIPITPRTTFFTASLEKSFIAAAVALLARDGKLSLDDDVRIWISDLPDYGSPITLRHLLNHTSGLRDFVSLKLLAGKGLSDPETREDGLRVILRQRELNFRPGEESDYSNSGYALLATVIERASGVRLADYLAQNVFAPLGMADTRVTAPDDVVPRRATAYAPYAGGGFRLAMPNADGIHTTVEDLARWDRNFYAPVVGDAAWIEQLVTPGRLNNDDHVEYALGQEVDRYRGRPRVFHAGAFGGYRAMLWRLPADSLSVALLCNVSSASAFLAEPVGDVYLTDPTTTQEEAGRVAELSARELAARAGTYYSRTTGGVVRVTLRGDRLLTNRFGSSELVARANDAFHFAALPLLRVQFLAPRGDAPWQLLTRWDNDPPRVFERVGVVTPAATELEPYVGVYYSREADITYTVRLDNGELRMPDASGRMRRLLPAVQDVFADDDLTLRFLREPDGRVTGLRLHTDRIRSLLFHRCPGGDGRCG